MIDSNKTTLTPAGNPEYETALDCASTVISPWVVAIFGLLSLNPYWFWYTSWHLIVAAGVTLLLAIALAWQYRRWPRGLEFAGVLLLTTFILYITVLPKVDGGHIRWVFVCPTLFALTLMPLHLRVRTLKIFAGLFALSVVPAILLSLYLVTGLPITLETMPYANRIMAAGGTYYVMLPGALVLEANSVILYWGGMLGRIAGIYDEPNSVGTVAGLIVAAFRCNVRDWRVIVALFAGMLSFSVAFLVLVSLASILSAIVLRTPFPTLAAIPAVLSGALLIGVPHLAAAPGTPTKITIKQPQAIEQSEKDTQPKKPVRAAAAEAEPVEASPTPPAEYRAREAASLRPQKFDSRSNPAMDALAARFWNSDWQSKLFGLGSDASVVHGSIASVVHRLYTDYGLIGLTLFVIGFGTLGLSFLRQSSYSPVVMLFLALFALSVYQRPVVWMPYALLLFFAASCNTVGDHDSRLLGFRPRYGLPR